MNAYSPEDYWEGLLGHHLDERGVAYPELAVALNRAMYRALEDSAERLLRDHGLAGRAGRVLDVGSGTGIWIEFWRRLGADAIVGLDLTDVAVTALRGWYPDLRFEQADFGAETLPIEGPFDVASAMSVFLHITDEQRFGQAFANLARLLRPGGHAVLIEAVLVHGWHGEPWGPEATSKARPVADYRAAIDAAGLDLVDLRPATVVLANPTDTRSRLAHGLAVRAWAVLQLGVGTDERRGRVAAAVLSAVDAPLRRLLPNGPSAKLLLLRRR